MARTSSRSEQEPAFVSRQVTDARRYYLNLNPPADARLVVVCGGCERMQADYVVSRQDFPYVAIELVVEGQGSLHLNGNRFALVPGTAFAYGPGIPHTIRNLPSSPMRKYYVDIFGTEVRDLLAPTGLLNWSPLRVAAFHELVEVFDSLHREATDNSPLGHAVCETTARLLLLKLQQRTVSGRRIELQSYATYERIRGHMESHYLRLHTVADVARECHVTPMYVSRLFQQYGSSRAYQFLLRLRMNRAAEMLLNEGLLVKQTAARLGFPDAFQFSRAFRRVYGVPPSALLVSSMRPVPEEAGPG